MPLYYTPQPPTPRNIDAKSRAVLTALMTPLTRKTEVEQSKIVSQMETGTGQTRGQNAWLHQWESPLEAE